MQNVHVNKKENNKKEENKKNGYKLLLEKIFYPSK